MLGLLTPLAAVAAAGQLAMFYFASPPWPGLPAATLGGHYLYIDRNALEMIAACVVATTATGRWAGLDYYLYRYVFKKEPL
jgi:thiosulfate dehydrogenase [quinone] large subunit